MVVVRHSIKRVFHCYHIDEGMISALQENTRRSDYDARRFSFCCHILLSESDIRVATIDTVGTFDIGTTQGRPSPLSL